MCVCARAIETHLLQPPYDCPVPHQPLPGQHLDLPAHAQPLPGLPSLPGEQHPRPPHQGLPLRDEVPLDQAEDAIGEHTAGADVEVADITGAEGEGPLREAVLGDVGVGGGQDGALGGGVGLRGGRVVVGVVGAAVGVGVVKYGLGGKGAWAGAGAPLLVRCQGWWW